MVMLNRVVALLLGNLVWLFALTAFADGGYFTTVVADQTQSAEAMGAQQALIFRDDEATTLFVQSSVKGELADFSWVLPLPQKPLSVAKAPQSLFKLLDDMTAPRVLRIHYEETQSGCLGLSSSSTNGGTDSGTLKSEDQAATDVTVVGSGLVGQFSYELLEAKTASGLTDWLSQNGYQAPKGLSSLATDYIKDGFVFMAAKVKRDGGTVNGLPAFAFRFAHDAPLLFPMRITAFSTTSTVPVLLYVASKDTEPVLTDITSYTEVLANQDICSTDEYARTLRSKLKEVPGSLALQYRDRFYAPQEDGDGEYNYDAEYSSWRLTRDDSTGQDLLVGGGRYRWRGWYDGNERRLPLAAYDTESIAFIKTLIGGNYAFKRYYGELSAEEMRNDILFWPETQAEASDSYYVSSTITQSTDRCPSKKNGCSHAPHPFWAVGLFLTLRTLLAYRKRTQHLEPG